MDHTIEVWSINGNHFAECTCGWRDKSLYLPVLESRVKGHRAMHADKGDVIEIV